MTDEVQKKNCAKCGMPVILTPNGWAHEGGGTYEQYCRMCGWRGGQVGSYTACPRCGESVALANDHAAS